MSHRRLKAIVAGIAVAATLPAGAVAVKGSDVLPAQKALSRLNAQRIANGLPGGVALDAQWSSRCATHNRWEIRNHKIQHQEPAGSPGASVDGNWAGINSVLAYNSPWLMANPWETAPYHLEGLLRPQLERTGISEIDGSPIEKSYAGQLSIYTCALTRPGWTRHAPAVDTFYSYPGAGTTYPFAEAGAEDPTTPGASVGIPNGTLSGPNILVFWDGPARGTPQALTSLVAGSVTGPSGPVPAKIVGVATAGAQVEPGDGFIIPIKPLVPSTRYTVSFTFQSDDGSRSLSKTIVFTTAGVPHAAASIQPLQIASQRWKGHASVAVRLGVRWPFVGQFGRIYRDVYSGRRLLASLPTGGFPLLPACDKVYIYKFPKGVGKSIGGRFYPITSVHLRLVIPAFSLGSTRIPSQALSWNLPRIVTPGAR
jgi:hypothetical protein